MRMMLVKSNSIIDGRPVYAGSLVEIDPENLGDMAANLAEVTGNLAAVTLDAAAVLPDDAPIVPAEPDDSTPVRRRRSEG